MLLGGSLPPVLIDPILELDDCEVSDFHRQRPVYEGSLSFMSASIPYMYGNF